MGVKGAGKKSLGLKEDLGGLEIVFQKANEFAILMLIFRQTTQLNSIHANQTTPHFAFSRSPLTQCLFFYSESLSHFTTETNSRNSSY